MLISSIAARIDSIILSITVEPEITTIVKMIALNTMQTIATGLEMRLKTVNGLRSAFSGFAKIANETIERIKETMLKYDAARKFNPIIAKINAVNEFLFP